MSRSVVVDASVALKWVVTEPGSDEAATLLDEMTAGTVALLAPEHLVGEVANGLRKRVAQKILTVEDACAALEASKPHLCGGTDSRAQVAARCSSRVRSRPFRVSDAARSNSSCASSKRPSLASRSPRTLGRRW